MAASAKGESESPKPSEKTLTPETPKEVSGRPFVQAPSMQVVLQIDASKLTAEEIVTIAKELKEVGASTIFS